MNYVVIMAGGSGERFWPLSRKARPKQLLPLLQADRTMLQDAIDRITPIVPIENVLIITSEILRQPIIDATPSLPPENVIAEPAKRNTAPCLALAASIIRDRSDEASVMAVLTADHFIGDPERFRQDVSTAMTYAAENNALVTLGITPTRAETGYGYIEVAERSNDAVLKVSSFREKPDAVTAEEYVASGRYFWNSGMFFWSVNSLQQAMDACLPDVGSWLHTPGAVAESFPTLPDISIDYGVMERADNVFVVPASFPWDDVGSWDSLLRMRQTDANGNVLQGAVVALNTSGCVIINARTDGHVVTATDLRDHVLVVTDNATMCCPTSDVQNVKKIVQALRELDRDDVL